MKACVIFNPVARGAKAGSFRAQLAALAAQCALKPTFAAGGGRALAAEAVREGFELLVAAGGDGTVNEVINGIADTPDGLSRVRLGILPLGTVNVFATELRLPTHFASAWAVIQAARDSTIDLAQVDFKFDNQPQCRLFAQLAGAGLDSSAIERVDWDLKRKIGRFAYVVAGMKAMRAPKPQIVVGTSQESLGGELVLIGNGQFYGGRLRLFPQADLRDGLLDVTVFPRVNWAMVARCGWGLVTDQLYTKGGARHLKADSFSLYCGTSLPFEVEGENVGHLPARFSVRRGALRVIVP